MSLPVVKARAFSDRFSVSEELAKGDRTLDVSSLFPSNPEFERLKSYKTPVNTPVLRLFLVALAGLLAFFIFLVGLAAIRGKGTDITLKNTMLIAALSVSLIGYLFVLATHVNIFYFDAPYTHYNRRCSHA